MVSDLDDVTNLRAASPAGSACRVSQCSQVNSHNQKSEKKKKSFAYHITSFPQEILQRSVSMEDQRQGASSSRAQSKTTLNDLLDTLKLLEEEPERLSEPKSYRKDKYSWIDEVSQHIFISAVLYSHSSFKTLILYSLFTVV